MAHQVIDRRETWRYLIRQLEVFQGSKSGGISEPKLADWPLAL